MNSGFAYVCQTLQGADLEQVLRAHIPMKQVGQQIIGKCPFHEDQGQSLVASCGNQTFFCHHCKVAGNAIDFLARFHKIDYRQAVEDLGTFIGLPPPPAWDASGTTAAAVASPEHQTLIETQTIAAHFYQHSLTANARAQAYLSQRGLTPEIIHSMGIGYAPGDWTGLSQAFGRYDDAKLVTTGLVIAAAPGSSRHDRFRDRIMFPIRSEEGDVIGFGGRVIDKGEPKYLNSPDTPTFDKSAELYGLFEGKDAITETGFCLITEGYMDVVALRQHGVTNVVATLGTATSEIHIEKLMRHTRHLVYSFDGDKAGQRAAWRALQAALPYLHDDMQFRFLFLPDEHDPDSFIRERGKTAFHALISASHDAATFVMRELLQRHRPDTLEGRARLAQELVPMLRQMPVAQTRIRLTYALAKACDLNPADAARLSGLSHIQLTSVDVQVAAEKLADG